MNKQPIFRFAPSPNGYLHLGHAFSAIKSYQMAKKMNGRFLLRIEDIDKERSRQEYIDAIYEDLSWLGIEWEEPVIKQSQRFELYQAAFNKLLEQKIIYPCFATRKEIKKAIEDLKIKPELDPDGAPIYPGLHKSLTNEEISGRIKNGEPYAYRINMTLALERIKVRQNPLIITSINNVNKVLFRYAQPEIWGDAVIIRKDTPTSYHLSVIVDDAQQNITHVVRGEDLEFSTDLHRLLQSVLNIDPPIYHHHRLLTDDEGKKLSKSLKSKSLRDLRREGIQSKKIINQFLNENIRVDA